MRRVPRQQETLQAAGKTIGKFSQKRVQHAGLDRADRGAIRVGGEELTGLCALARVMF